ncbi:MAG TPA: YaiI/YqxD family protein [Alphaproteobacteria bacterium]|nr:YaiI/YqxD family protein [Alphaproteobacteria bacterium]
MLDLYVDGDACPVKDEILRVARRHGLTVHLVSNRWHRGPDDPLVKQVVVAEGSDAADDWIATHIGPGDIAVTADIPLAARCLDRQAKVLSPNGKPFTEASIGMALAMRDLSAHLRELGDRAGGPRPFGKQDRSRFLSKLEETIQAARRGRG